METDAPDGDNRQVRRKRECGGGADRTVKETMEADGGAPAWALFLGSGMDRINGNIQLAHERIDDVDKKIGDNGAEKHRD